MIDSNIIFTNTLYDNIAKAKDELSGSWIRIDPIVTLKFSCLYKTVVDVDNTISVQPSFLEGSSNGRGNFNFLLQTYSDPEFSIEQSNGFKTGEVMYFDVTIDRVVTGVQFSGTLKTIRSKKVYCRNPISSHIFNLTKIPLLWSEKDFEKQK